MSETDPQGAVPLTRTEVVRLIAHMVTATNCYEGNVKDGGPVMPEKNFETREAMECWLIKVGMLHE
jgi:hypothetical protein